ncbi:hypothetical protein SPRG_10469 [Saprolegnia parasitica CBS 223.65]|uniref:Uncharacterized protein n=1 Tax=Saprolegnia parasitica (strain CBS 223.65) TaxID=695850 RepID=A0A067CC42_SAPPC|nr:hypothetical protein SPRG_10469 [Saprolegnia parasitica CBS 223.65]KDO24392.1 hypothetical protein SPRG_10469 [Saprolegnia parasitica CBS 223.65]|eukprot:XP_012204984.1 hypothetical protein SPRG_10469 [Saprolegnia parasitica CBS 223.65]
MQPFLRATTPLRALARGRLAMHAMADGLQLQRAMAAHMQQVFPDGLARALDQSDRHGTPTLHGESFEKAKTILKNPKNQRFLWQEAARLNASGQPNVVLDVLYAKIFAAQQRQPSYLPRTTSLFLQQVLLAALATSNATTAVDALVQLAAVDADLVPHNVRTLSVDAVLRLALESAPHLVADIAPLLAPLHVALDAAIAPAVLRALFETGAYETLLALAASAPGPLPLTTHANVLVAMFRAGHTIDHVQSRYVDVVLGAYADASQTNVLGFLLVHACTHEQFNVVADVLTWMETHAYLLPVDETLVLYHTLLPSSTTVSEHCLVELLEAYPAVLPATTRTLSLAVSASSFFQHPSVATRVLDYAQAKSISILDVAYGHAGATAGLLHRHRFKARYKDDFLDGKVATARQTDVHDAGYHFTGALLQFMCAQNAHDAIELLLKELQYYQLEATEDDMDSVLRSLPPHRSLYSLYEAYPRVVKNAPLALTRGVADLLRIRPRGSATAAEMDQAMQLWRCYVWTEAVKLDDSVFGLLTYAALRDQRSVSMLTEIATQYTQQEAGRHLATLHSAVLQLCASCNDASTMATLLRQRPAGLPPLNDVDIDHVLDAMPSTEVSVLGYLQSLPNDALPWTSPRLLSRALVAALSARHATDAIEVLGRAIDSGVELSADACRACVLVLQDDAVDASFKVDVQLSMETLWATTTDASIRALLDRYA